jgi:hypothetical protein
MGVKEAYKATALLIWSLEIMGKKKPVETGFPFGVAVRTVR